jgi:hypothetical protein
MRCEVLTCSEFFSPLSLFVQFLFFQIFETRISFGRISRSKLSGRHDGDGDTFKAQNSKRNSGFSFFFFSFEIEIKAERERENTVATVLRRVTYENICTRALAHR